MNATATLSKNRRTKRDRGEVRNARGIEEALRIPTDPARQIGLPDTRLLHERRTPAEVVEDRELITRIVERAALSTRQTSIIESWLGLRGTPAELARDWRISRQRVEQLRHRALAKLRRAAITVGGLRNSSKKGGCEQEPVRPPD